MTDKTPSVAEHDALLIEEAARLFGRRCQWSATAWITGRVSTYQAEQFLLDDFKALRSKIRVIRGEA